MRNKKSRPAAGRGLFYNRDSGGKHEMSPGQYLIQAQTKAKELGVRLSGSVTQFQDMIKDGRSSNGDIFFDYCVRGNVLTRPGLSALMEEVEADCSVSHVFVHHRDRLARPDYPHEGVALENKIRTAGVTLVVGDLVLKPLKRGYRQDIGELVTAQIDYHTTGQFRDDHAEKMIAAKSALARGGYSTGGRPPYGFRRHLVNVNGKVVRELVDGERVRLAGHHVAWLPGPAEELDVIFRIVEMLETLPAMRVAQLLTDAKIPTPNAGRKRTDNGHEHTVSGRWSQTTVVAIARHPLLRAMVAFGRRTMGERRRFTPDGPRHVEDEDFRPDGQPKVRQVDPKNQIIVPASFDALITPEGAMKLDEILDRRASSQRGKPRSQNPERNPLGCRIFDMACSRTMYRIPKGEGKYSYTCAQYMQSKGQACDHNCISGPAAVKVGVEVIRQHFHDPELRQRLRDKLETRLSLPNKHASKTDELARASASILEAKARLDRVGRNMALASNDDQLEVMKKAFDEIGEEVRTLERRIVTLSAAPAEDISDHRRVEMAMELLDRLPDLVACADEDGKAKELFQIMDLKMFLSFEKIQKTKRVVNKLAGGIVTLGAASPPIQPYSGPMSRRHVQKALEAVSEAPSSGEGDQSLGNVSRGDMI